MHIHSSFKLNGLAFENSEDLLVYAKSKDDCIYRFLKDWFNCDVFLTVQTSGSTGIPKLIQLKKGSMVQSALATADYFQLHAGTKALLCMSADYIAGKMMLVRALTLGWELDVVEPVANPLLQLNKQYDFCAMVPLQVQSSLNELYKVKKIIVGGGELSQKLMDKIQQSSTQVFATYGMTETITHVAVQALNQGSTNYFKCLPGVKVVTDSRGCLKIMAPRISENEIVTNDLAELISDTKFRWLGRIDNVINSGGVKLLPETIESKIIKLLEHPYFIAAEKDVKFGEKVILVIESKPYNELQINKLKQELQTVLSKFEMPKSIYFIDKFLETATKKIQRRQTLDLIINQSKN
ncbi:MAG: AMP-binding protein [Bacteroidetes bacterium]|nr:AMP-binding protein [Bacteroidota bacterium]